MSFIPSVLFRWLSHKHIVLVEESRFSIFAGSILFLTAADDIVFLTDGPVGAQQSLSRQPKTRLSSPRLRRIRAGRLSSRRFGESREALWHRLSILPPVHIIGVNDKLSLINWNVLLAQVPHQIHYSNLLYIFFAICRQVLFSVVKIVSLNKLLQICFAIGLANFAGILPVVPKWDNYYVWRQKGIIFLDLVLKLIYCAKTL